MVTLNSLSLLNYAPAHFFMIISQNSAYPSCSLAYRVYKLSLINVYTLPPHTAACISLTRTKKTVTSASSTATHHSTAIWTSIMVRSTHCEWAALHWMYPMVSQGGTKGVPRGHQGRGRNSHNDEHHSSCRGMREIYKENMRKGWLVACAMDDDEGEDDAQKARKAEAAAA